MSTGLSESIQIAVALLERDAESVRAVLSGEENRFSRALQALQQLAEGEGIPIAIVSGLGAIRYGYPAVTQDIDVVVGRGDLDRLTMRATMYGLKAAWAPESGWHTLSFGDVEINVVPEGGKARNSSPTTIPGPAALDVLQGLAYASLPGWMELKLSSGRQKDRAHVVEVMKACNDAILVQARVHLESVHPQYVALFDELREEASEEKNQEGERGKR
ncbi:MAG: hypothetical protein K2X38_00635 [Gemmataceae bacterium]|nr:hypothetical protein [Gemmataceae bacterium]